VVGWEEGGRKKKRSEGNMCRATRKRGIREEGLGAKTHVLKARGEEPKGKEGTEKDKANNVTKAQARNRAYHAALKNRGKKGKTKPQ